jgi:tetratricopeptide (TPR) repeat protein
MEETQVWRPRRRRVPIEANHIIVMLIAGVAVFGTVVAALQTHANARAARAVRTAQSQSILLLKADTHGLFDLTYTLDVVRTWWELQRLTMLAGRRASESVEAAEAQAFEMEAQRLAAAVEGLLGQSDVFAEPYYDAVVRPWPDLNRFWYERLLAPRVLAAEQQAAESAIGQAWNSKSNAYQTVITLVAVTLFLYGLALTVESHLKWGFFALGSANMAFITAWTVLTVVRPVPQIPEAALRAYVDGYIEASNALQLEYASSHALVPERADRAIAHLNEAIALRPDYAAAYTLRADAFTVKGEALLFGEGDAALRDDSLRAAVRDYDRALSLNPEDYHAYWNLAWALYLVGDYERSIEVIQEAARLAPLKAFGARLVLATTLLGMGRLDEGLAECRAAIAYAAEHPLSSDAYYFRQAIRNAERLQAVRPHDGLDQLDRLLKEAFVSLQYRGSAQPGAATGQLGELSFGAPTMEQASKASHFWMSQRFPADTEQVNVIFDYDGMVDGQQVVLKVYRDGVEQPFYNQVIRWEDGATGRSTRLAVKLPVEGTGFGLTPGGYRVEIYVEGNLRASGEFTIGS